MARVVVLGGAESGVGAAVLAKVKGFDVFLSDKGQIKEAYAAELRKWEIPFEEGQHTEELILNADEVVKSPGIPGTVPMVQKIREKGIRVVAQRRFASPDPTAKPPPPRSSTTCCRTPASTWAWAAISAKATPTR